MNIFDTLLIVALGWVLGYFLLRHYVREDLERHFDERVAKYIDAHKFICKDCGDTTWVEGAKSPSEVQCMTCEKESYYRKECIRLEKELALR